MNLPRASGLTAGGSERDGLPIASGRRERTRSASPRLRVNPFFFWRRACVPTGRPQPSLG